MPRSLAIEQLASTVYLSKEDFNNLEIRIATDKSTKDFTYWCAVITEKIGFFTKKCTYYYVIYRLYNWENSTYSLYPSRTSKKFDTHWYAFLAAEKELNEIDSKPQWEKEIFKLDWVKKIPEI